MRASDGLHPTTRLGWLALCVVLGDAPGCGSSRSREPAPAPDPPAAPVMGDARALDAAAVPPPCGTTRALAPGLTWQTVPIARPAPVDLGDHCLYLVRIDPAAYELRVLTAFVHGDPRSAPAWASAFELVAVINTSMYRPNNRSTGLLVHDGQVNNGEDTRKFGAFLAFDPVGQGDPPVAMFGRGCPGFDLNAIRARYRSVIQNYRILDCQARAIAWKDPKIYSAAAVAMDAEGRVVFIHVRTPYLMRDLAEILAEPGLGLRAAMFVEGGHEATLHVAAGGLETTLVGSYESATAEHDDNQVAWPLPNVIGVAPRQGGDRLDGTQTRRASPRGPMGVHIVND